MDKIHEWPNGVAMYVENNGVGGRRYWSDAIGGGVVVYDTCLASEDEILCALDWENGLLEAEKSHHPGQLKPAKTTS